MVSGTKIANFFRFPSCFKNLSMQNSCFRLLGDKRIFILMFGGSFSVKSFSTCEPQQLPRHHVGNQTSLRWAFVWFQFYFVIVFNIHDITCLPRYMDLFSRRVLSERVKVYHLACKVDCFYERVQSHVNVLICHDVKTQNHLYINLIFRKSFSQSWESIHLYLVSLINYKMNDVLSLINIFSINVWVPK